MREHVTVVLMGEPVAWARTRLGKASRPYTPPKQRNNSAALQVAAMTAMDGKPPLEGPLHLSVDAHFAIPSSWSRRKKEAALRGEIRPARRPDLSNIVKQVEDSFNSVVFRDDALIVEYGRCRKVYGMVPMLVVTVRGMFPIPGLEDLPNDTLDNMIDGKGDY